MKSVIPAFRRALPIGLDLDADGLRAVQLGRAGATWTVLNALELKARGAQPAGVTQVAPDAEQTPAAPAAEDAATPEAALPDLLARFGRYPGFHGRRVIVHCPADRLDMRPVSLPAGPEGLARDAILGALRMQIKSFVNFPPEQTVFDYFPVEYNEHNKALTVMAVTAHALWIRRRLEMLTATGLECVGIDALPCALTRLLLHSLAAETPLVNLPGGENSAAGKQLYALIHLGLRDTILLAAMDAGPVFARRFEFSAAAVKRLLMQRLALSPAQAGRLPAACAAGAEHHSNYGDETRAQVTAALLGAARNDLNDLCEGLLRSLNYVVNEHRGATLERICISGELAELQPLAQYLADRFDMPVRPLWHPLHQEIASRLPATRRRVTVWNGALGLALPREVA